MTATLTDRTDLRTCAAGAAELDAVDETILSALRLNARVTNKELARQAGVAASTCLARVARLERIGVVSGYHAAIDHQRLGHVVEAVVTVRVRPASVAAIDSVARELAASAVVAEARRVVGRPDLMLRVVGSVHAVQKLLRDRLPSHPAVAAVQTRMLGAAIS